MKKRTLFITILLIIVLALIGLYKLGRNCKSRELGEGPLTCYIEGELLTDKFGAEIVIFEYPLDCFQGVGARATHPQGPGPRVIPQIKGKQ